MYIIGIDAGKNHHEASIDSFLIAEVIQFGQFITTSMDILEKYLTSKNIQNAPPDEIFEIKKR